MNDVKIQGVADEAAMLVEKTLDSLAKAQVAAAALAQRPAPLFFPNGIELLYFKLTFGKEIDLTIAIAGEKAKYPGAPVTGNAILVGDEHSTVASEV